MKRNLIIIIATLVCIIVMMLLGNIIIIGEKIGHLTVWWLEYVFYGLILLLALYFLIVPMIRIHRAPPFPVLGVSDDADERELRAFGRKLVGNCRYITDAERRKDHQRRLDAQLLQASGDVAKLKQCIRDEVEIRLNGNEEMDVKGINYLIKDWGKTTFMLTAISQNSKVDTVGMIIMNYKMIESIVCASGFRPTSQQLFRMYVSILSTSLITYCLSEALSDTGDLAPFDFGDLDEDAATESVVEASSGDSGFSFYGFLRKLKIPGVIVGSLADGAINLLMTLRIGYVTRAYLLQGAQSMSNLRGKVSVRRAAMKEALKAAPAIAAAGSGQIGKKAYTFASDFIKNKI